MTPTTKPVPVANLDFTKDTYKGALIQHLLLELGSVQRPERLAVLGKGINGKKGTFMKGLSLSTDTVLKDDGKEKLKPIDSAFQAMQIDSYMLSEMDSFCASIDGVYNILKKFDADMKKKAVTPPDMSGLTLDDKTKSRPAGQGSAPGIAGDKTYADVVKTTQKPSRRSSTGEGVPGPGGRPSRGPKIDYSGAQEDKDETPAKDRKDQNVDPKAGSKIQMAEVRGPANVPAVRSDLANRWKKFLQSHFSEKTVKNMNAFYKGIAAKAGASAIGEDKKKWEKVAEFKATWYDRAMRTCETFKSPANIDTASSDWGASDSGSSAPPSPLDGKGKKKQQVATDLQRLATTRPVEQEPVLTHKKMQPNKQNKQETGGPTA